MHKLTSRERLQSAYAHSEVDHVPLYIKWWNRPFLANPRDAWKNQFERVEKTLRLGLDDTVGFEPPRMFASDVRVKCEQRRPLGERYPILFKEYFTPKGILTQAVSQTNDWPFGNDIPILTDYAVPSTRSKKYLIEKMADVEILSSIFTELEKRDLQEFREEVEQTRRFAAQNNVLIECGGMVPDTSWTMKSDRVWRDGMDFFLGDGLAWLCGLENAVKFAVRNPGLLHKLLDVIHQWNLTYLDVLESVGSCDVVVHRGWYEFIWSPKLYRTFILPRLKEEVEQVHRLGAKFCYVMTTGIMQYLEIFKELHVDILYGVDPVQGGADLKQLKERIGDRVCLCGGVNSAVTLKNGSKNEVTRAVTQALTNLAPGGGFVLSAIDQLFEDTRWENVTTMIDVWRSMHH